MRQWLLVPLISSIAFAQGMQGDLSFEVAEIKLNNSGPGEARGDIANGRLTVSNVPLRFLIAEAWSVTPDSVYGPSWLDDVRVDVVAKAASPRASDVDVRLMVQSLLRDRMRLAAHVEPRQEPVWALTVWKARAKMKPSEMPAKPEDASCSLNNSTSGVHLHCEHMTMALFAHKLPQIAPGYADKRVVDQTGLSGAWEVALDWTPVAQADSDGGLTLFAALQAQLGLQLENKKAEVPVVVVDRMERTPTEN